MSTNPSLLLKLRPDDRVWGAAKSSVTLIQYGCYTCAACAQIYPILCELQTEFATQQQLVYRHFPQPDPTQQALHAAEAAEAAHAQGRFWQMHELLLAHQTALGDGELVEYAIALRLNVSQFLREMRQDVHVDRVRFDLDSGIQLGIDRVPAIFINGQRYWGDWNFDALSAEITTILGQSQSDRG